MKETDTLIVQKDPKSCISESYRVLRTNIQFYNFEKQYKTILITSSGIGEGKSTVISNLAVAMAQSGGKVLLLEADFRRPTIYKFFNLSNKKGLTDILVSGYDNYKEFIQGTEIDNLDIITSGPIPPNPSELLGSHSMKNFLEAVKNEYDVILIDSPPAGTITDAAVLSTIADGVMLLVSSGKASIESVKRAQESLQKVNANIIGAILNNVRIDNNDYYYKYYSLEDNAKEKKKHKKKKKPRNKKKNKDDKNG